VRTRFTVRYLVAPRCTSSLVGRRSQVHRVRYVAVYVNVYNICQNAAAAAASRANLPIMITMADSAPLNLFENVHMSYFSLYLSKFGSRVHVILLNGHNFYNVIFVSKQNVFLLKTVFWEAVHVISFGDKSK
jgi:hypothetical protein